MRTRLARLWLLPVLFAFLQSGSPRPNPITDFLTLEPAVARAESVSTLILFARAQESPLQTVTLPSGSTLQVEIADTPEKRTRGLMFRKDLHPTTGMLFIYPKPGSYRIWMKNCYIPLDILWLNADKQIIEFKEQAPPCQKDPCPVYGTTDQALYVLETAAGSIKRHRLIVGTRIHF